MHRPRAFAGVGHEMEELMPPRIIKRHDECIRDEVSTDAATTERVVLSRPRRDRLGLNAAGPKKHPMPATRMAKDERLRRREASRDS